MLKTCEPADEVSSGGESARARRPRHIDTNSFVAQGFDGVEVGGAHGRDHPADYADDGED